MVRKTSESAKRLFTSDHDQDKRMGVFRHFLPTQEGAAPRSLLLGPCPRHVERESKLKIKCYFIRYYSSYHEHKYEEEEEEEETFI